MKFDVVVGNPPYQQSRDDTRDDAIYNHFYDLAKDVSERYCLITPARFLFNAGSTDKKWNEKMLNDDSLKVELFEQDSKKIFPNTDIKGGVAILYRDDSKSFGRIGVFTPHEELNAILRKVEKVMGESLGSIITGQGIYRFTKKMHEDNQEVSGILPKSHQYDISTGVLGTLRGILFFEQKPDDGSSYMQILGRYKSQRVKMWIRRDYVSTPEGFDKWRVVFPKSNGSGKLGEPLSSPSVIEPLTGFTQTFLSMGAFEHKKEADNALAYVKSKFLRAMLGILKITQDNPASKWKYVPLQDFTEKSDIDWNCSQSDLDTQLYDKYGLSEKEISFIEEKVKPME